MKKAHLVFAHPNPKSLNGRLRDLAIQTLSDNAWEVSVSNLFQEHFKAAADAEDFLDFDPDDYLDLQKEQVVALAKQTFSEDILREQALLAQSDLIIFQFPLWWYSVPAPLKGYIDRVFSLGFAYGRGGDALAGKSILLSTTTGAPEMAWNPATRGTLKENLRHLLVGTFPLCGLKSIEPFVVYGAKRLTEEQKEAEFVRFREHLMSLPEMES
jgi:NAD(P)H dehydrogenase (quinone)